MSWIWILLGALLIAVVFSVCIGFFVVRPRLAKKINAGARGLAKELHGRPPLLSGAAACEGSSDPARFGLQGLGALGLTEQALVFVAGQSEESVIIPLSTVIEATPATSYSSAQRTIRRSRPMLVVRWWARNDQEVSIGFTVDDAAVWVAAMPRDPLRTPGPEDANA